MHIVFVFQLVLIVLRLTDTVDWSWWIILLPAIVVYGGIALFVFACWVFCMLKFGVWR